MAARSQEDEKEGRSRIRVCYLGPEATFCHEAALKQFGGGPGYLPAASISGVFEAVENDRADKGVVPVENAIEGTVNVTLDHLIDSPLEIVGEVLLPIDIHLLTHTESVSDIQRVLSHPHAVAQCRTWLQENLPDVHVEEVASTALAAKEVAGDARYAALGSQLAGEHYGLPVLVSKLDTESINITRFFVLGKEKPPPQPKCLTSILFALPNKPGGLYNAFAPLAERGLNLTKIESRPSRRKAWEYIFFMDVEGHVDDSVLAEGLAALRERVQYLRVLGSYPLGR